MSIRTKKNAPSAIPITVPLFSFAQLVVVSCGISSFDGLWLDDGCMEGALDSKTLKDGTELLTSDGAKVGVTDGCKDGLLLKDGTELAFTVGVKDGVRDGGVDGCRDGSND